MQVSLRWERVPWTGVLLVASLVRLVVATCRSCRQVGYLRSGGIPDLNLDRICTTGLPAVGEPAGGPLLLAATEPSVLGGTHIRQMGCPPLN